jgi:hypothetical protein
MLRLLHFLFGRRPRTRRSLLAIRVAFPSIPADWPSTWAVAWDIPDLASPVEIVFSRRIRRSLGRCVPRTGEIRLNPALLQAGDDVLREVLCHEAAHAATWILRGNASSRSEPPWARTADGWCGSS